MMKKCCEKCIHSRQDWYSERNDMVKCEKRKKSVNKGDFLCRYYAEALEWQTREKQELQKQFDGYRVLEFLNR